MLEDFKVRLVGKNMAKCSMCVGLYFSFIPVENNAEILTDGPQLKFNMSINININHQQKSTDSFNCIFVKCSVPNQSVNNFNSSGISNLSCASFPKPPCSMALHHYKRANYEKYCQKSNKLHYLKQEGPFFVQNSYFPPQKARNESLTKERSQ